MKGEGIYLFDHLIEKKLPPIFQHIQIFFQLIFAIHHISTYSMLILSSLMILFFTCDVYEKKSSEQG